MKTYIRYREGYKYQLHGHYRTLISIFPPLPILTDYIALDVEGGLTLAKGYAWNGPSGPAIPTATFMRGSLIHDALYQLLRERHLAPELRAAADWELYKSCREDGMSWIRARYVYYAVRSFGNFAADPAHDRPILTSPSQED